MKKLILFSILLLIPHQAFAGLSTEDSVKFKQIATPATPSTNYNKLYFKSDDKLYKLDDAGNEVEVGASGSSGHTIQDEGTPLTARTNLNFVGGEVTVTDGGAGPDSTIVTIPTVTTISGNAGTATALAANGANCGSGEYPLGVDASGAVESCTDATTEIDSAISTHVSDVTSVHGLNIVNTPAAGDLLVRNAGNTAFEDVPMSGDGTIASTGALTVADDSHAHTTTTLSGIDIGDDTNLAGTLNEITLTGDTLSAAAAMTRDAEWDTEGEVQTAWGAVNILLETEIDASAELRALMDDESGTGALLFADGALGAATATTASADDNDTSVATTAYVQTEINAMGGRSLTAASGSMDADSELYTRTICYRLPASPVAGDDDKSIWINDGPTTFTVTKLWAESDQTVTLMLQVDDGTPADMDTVDLIAITTPDTDTSLDGDATIAAGDRVDVDVASVSGTPTWCTICFTGEYGD